MTKATNKNNKTIIETMDLINLKQLELQKNCTTTQQCNIKQQLKYLKYHDKNIHKINKHMVNVIFNINITMCHAFIQDKVLLPRPLNFASDSLKKENVLDKY